MTQPPQDSQPDPWNQPSPSSPPDPWGQPPAAPPGPPAEPAPPQFGQPQYGQPAPPPFGSPQYGQPAPPSPQYGQPQYGQPQYGQPPSGPREQYAAANFGGGPASSGYPVQLSVEYPQSQSRLLAALSIPFFLARLIMLIPALICLYFVSAALGIVAWIGMWAVAFTGHYPQGMFNFVVGGLRWNSRALAYLYGLTDKYPPFSLQP